MVKIDLKDRRILYELDYNSRESLTQIGKKVGLKKDVVSYRIKKLQEEGVIQCFYTVIDAYKLGYTLFRYYINYQFVNPEIRTKIKARKRNANNEKSSRSNPYSPRPGRRAQPLGQCRIQAIRPDS